MRETDDRYNYIDYAPRLSINLTDSIHPTIHTETNETTNDIIVFSRNLGHYRKKPTSGLFTYIKPYRNIETTTQYDASLFSFDPQNPNRLHQHFAHHRDDIHVELANFSSEASELFTGTDYDAGGGGEVSLTNDPIEDESEELYSIADGDYVDKMPATRRNTVVSMPEVSPEQTALSFGNYSWPKNQSLYGLIEDETDNMEFSYDESFISKQFKGLANNNTYRSGLELKNSYRKFRRKDSALKYTRGWFISNHIPQFNSNISMYSPS